MGRYTGMGLVACLRLEERGIYVKFPHQRSRTRFASPTGNRRPWVARIQGTCPKYNLERKFEWAMKDYRDASRSGRSGIYHYFFLRPGVYEIYEILNTTRTTRYFGVSDGGVFARVEKDEVMKWVGSHH